MAPQTRRHPANAPVDRVYETATPPEQARFPARSRVVRTYGRKTGQTAAVSSIIMRQQTLTQIDYLRQQQPEPPAGLEGIQEDDDEEEGETTLHEIELTEPKSEPKPKSKAKTKAKTKKEPANKRRKTMDDTPSSSFHTQTLTQMRSFSGKTAVNSDNELRIKESESQDEDWEEPTLPTGNTPRKMKSNPHTPSTKRIKVNLDEVPSSQPTPFTPMIARYSPMRSPLKEKSTNVDAPPPTAETVSKRPRTLVIQDSYSEGPGLPSSSLGASEDTPRKEWSSQKRKREPLAEIPLAGLDLEADVSIGETQTKQRREIPDSDDELESVVSTPFKTPRGKAAKIWSEPGSGSQAPEARDVPSTGASNKENRTPSTENPEEREEPGTPTPTVKSKKVAETGSSGKPSTQRRVSQRLSARKLLERKTSPQKSPLANPTDISVEAEDGEDLTASEDEAPTPTLPKIGSQKRASSANKKRSAITISSFTKRSAKGASSPILSNNNQRHTTPQIPTSEDSINQGLTTPTPRRVQIELPPPTAGYEEDEDEEIYKETPQKPLAPPALPHKKSSPITYQRQTQQRQTQHRQTQQRLTQRQTQHRSQYYSQGLESQRVPLEVIKSLGPQTDRSDVLVSLPKQTVEAIIDGWQNHLFRVSQPIPLTVTRVWIYTSDGLDEVKYMATIGPKKEPGEIQDLRVGRGNAEFNEGESVSGFRFAHELLQVYRLNDPIKKREMVRSGLKENGGPGGEMWRWVGPAVAAALLANLREALFVEVDGDEDWDEEMEEDLLRAVEEDEEQEAEVTISQELAEQLRSEGARMEEEEEVIPASQEDPFLPPPPPPPQVVSKKGKASQRKSQRSQRSQTRSQLKRDNMVRPSQATTASDVSSAPSSPVVARPSAVGASGEDPSLPDLLRREEESDSLLLRGMAGGSSGGMVVGLSSQPPFMMDSLLADEGEVRRPPEIIWDS
ncbi:hypothetical protein QBC38DRAFT_379396, partial [Podospora fimiseda]